jgi:hypothetical protein
MEKMRKRARSIPHLALLEQANPLPLERDPIPEDKRVRYKITYPYDDGEQTYFSGPLIRGGPQSEEDKRTLYFDEAREEFCPIPQGWVSPGPPGTDQEQRENERREMLYAGGNAQ